MPSLFQLTSCLSSCSLRCFPTVVFVPPHTRRNYDNRDDETGGSCDLPLGGAAGSGAMST